jgi:FAS-associated factor 2
MLSCLSGTDRPPHPLTLSLSVMCFVNIFTPLFARFPREILCSDVFVNFLNTNMLLWACNTSSPEGYRVSQALREHAYPFLAVIVLRDNKMSVVARIEGHVTGSQELIERLEQVMAENESSLVTARAERAERSFNQSLRQQQDEAYLESLRADQEKEKKRREEKEKQELEELKQRQVKEEEEQKFLQKEEKKSNLERLLPPEPEAEHPDSIRIMLKIPNGSRIERRFLRTHSIKWLFYYVFCHKDCPDDFQIVTNFPKRTLPCEPTDEEKDPPSFEEIGLGKSEMLFVHDNQA